MLTSTLPRLRCPACQECLALEGISLADAAEAREISYGTIRCEGCSARYPILAGVAVLVEDVGSYLLSHAKGISPQVPDRRIPPEYLSDYLEAKAELAGASEHIEEDLEAERVNSLYLMNHYLHASPGQALQWWKPARDEASPLLRELIERHWDQGPFTRIFEWLECECPECEWLECECLEGGVRDVLELGCGVGGLAGVLAPVTRRYLGVDSSFASVALARHLNLGTSHAGKLRIPEDLLQGPVSREIRIEPRAISDGSVDFVVGDVENPPLELAGFEVSIALNTIDMLEKPEELPLLMSALTRPGGLAIQSCPYIWHEVVARSLRESLPPEIRESSRAVEWLFGEAGLKIEKRIEHQPWLFFKHVRQLEIYSVHLFSARKPAE